MPSRRAAMVVARTRREAQEWARAQRAAGKRIAFAPTMGALHLGHVSLIKLGLEHADIAASSIFVNPTQFSANEDYATYPRTEARDLDALAEAGCGFVYCPAIAEMYPPADSTRVVVKDLSHILEGEVRPHFFEGVATVVSRLFLHVTPDVAVFGEKDYQQLLVIRRMAIDLGFPIEVLGAPTVREADGLAMSSRNAYLTPELRELAVGLSQAMKHAIDVIESGLSMRGATEAARASLIEMGFAGVDYVEARRADTLAAFGSETAPVGAPGRLLAAARLGKTRLIDNMPFQRK